MVTPDNQQTEQEKQLYGWMNAIHTEQQAQTKILKQMNIAIQIIGAIVLISAILTGCGALLR